MPIEAHYPKRPPVRMMEIMRYYVTHIQEFGELPMQKIAASSLGMSQSNLAKQMNSMGERGYIEKIGEISKNGKPEGYKFYPEKMGITDKEN